MHSSYLGPLHITSGHFGAKDNWDEHEAQAACYTTVKGKALCLCSPSSWAANTFCKQNRAAVDTVHTTQTALQEWRTSCPSPQSTAPFGASFRSRELPCPILGWPAACTH